MCIFCFCCNFAISSPILSNFFVFLFFYTYSKIRLLLFKRRILIISSFEEIYKKSSFEHLRKNSSFEHLRKNSSIEHLRKNSSIEHLRKSSIEHLRKSSFEHLKNQKLFRAFEKSEALSSIWKIRSSFEHLKKKNSIDHLGN